MADLEWSNLYSNMQFARLPNGNDKWPLEPGFVEGAIEIAQRIQLTLEMHKGEWFLDQNAGTDWRGKVLGKTKAPQRNAYLRQLVRSVRGVADVDALETTYDGVTRKLTVKGIARLESGETVPFEATQ